MRGSKDNTAESSFEMCIRDRAYTMGIKTIMQARKILLIVSGEDKAQSLYDVLNGPITPHVPASILQLHSDVTVVADEAALSKF